jgi:hypothetical protein
LGWDDTEFGYAEIDSRDELLQAQIDETYLKMGGETINAVLNRRGLPSVAGGDEPMVFTGTAYIPVRYLDRYAQEQLKVLQVAASTPGDIKTTPPKAAGAMQAGQSFPDNDTKGKSAPRVTVKPNQGAPNQTQSRGPKDAAKRAGVRND